MEATDICSKRFPTEIQALIAEYLDWTDIRKKLLGSGDVVVKKVFETTPHLRQIVLFNPFRRIPASTPLNFPSVSLRTLRIHVLAISVGERQADWACTLPSTLTEIDFKFIGANHMWTRPALPEELVQPSMIGRRDRTVMVMRDYFPDLLSLHLSDYYDKYDPSTWTQQMRIFFLSTLPKNLTSLSCIHQHVLIQEEIALPASLTSISPPSLDFGTLGPARPEYWQYRDFRTMDYIPQTSSIWLLAPQTWANLVHIELRHILFGTILKVLSVNATPSLTSLSSDTPDYGDRGDKLMKRLEKYRFPPSLKRLKCGRFPSDASALALVATLPSGIEELHMGSSAKNVWRNHEHQGEHAWFSLPRKIRALSFQCPYVEEWPPELRSLHLYLASCCDYIRLPFPDTLATLSFKLEDFSPKNLLALFAALPPSLTSLSISHDVRIPRQMVQLIPRSVTLLRFESEYFDSTHFPFLPPSLVTLQLPRLNLFDNDLPELPRTLTYLQANAIKISGRTFSKSMKIFSFDSVSEHVYSLLPANIKLSLTRGLTASGSVDFPEIRWTLAIKQVCPFGFEQIDLTSTLFFTDNHIEPLRHLLTGSIQWAAKKREATTEKAENYACRVFKSILSNLSVSIMEDICLLSGLQELYLPGMTWDWEHLKLPRTLTNLTLRKVPQPRRTLESLPLVVLRVLEDMSGGELFLPSTLTAMQTPSRWLVDLLDKKRPDKVVPGSLRFWSCDADFKQDELEGLPAFLQEFKCRSVKVAQKTYKINESGKATVAKIALPDGLFPCRVCVATEFDPLPSKQYNVDI